MSSGIFRRIVQKEIKFVAYCNGQVAQLVEQWIENPCVGGSIPPLTTSETSVKTTFAVVFLFADSVAWFSSSACFRSFLLRGVDDLISKKGMRFWTTIHGLNLGKQVTPNSPAESLQASQEPLTTSALASIPDSKI